ncbi:MAG: GNAT family N-acetyltransferase [Oscillospiraceae bacterium]|nr:GNAT family N-acetyltransferase [Oscillospiraceae bacterium]
MGAIRKAKTDDAARIAEMLVFNNRLYYFPIFRDEAYSFGRMQVPAVEREYLDPQALAQTFVFDDGGIVKGMIRIRAREIVKLYVEPSFQGQGIGAALLDFAVARHGADHLWALEKNTRALAFYGRNGFRPTGERVAEEGTAEYLLRLAR